MENSRPAFPIVKAIDEDIYAGGMTLRDYFAGQALAGILAYPEPDTTNTSLDFSPKVVAERSYAFADAMLVEKFRIEDN